MIEQIREPVDVLVSFSGGQIRPRAFLWRNRKYRVDSVNLSYSSRDGREPVYFFAVSDGANSYKLCFLPAKMSWKLMEMYVEG